MHNKGPHVRYLLFFWIGQIAGLLMGHPLFQGNPIHAVYMLFGFLIIGLIATVIFQQIWLRKQAPVEHECCEQCTELAASGPEGSQFVKDLAEWEKDA
jgi:predicted lipid-binding transport protein (Tim44 family)